MKKEDIEESTKRGKSFNNSFVKKYKEKLSKTAKHRALMGKK